MITQDIIEEAKKRLIKTYNPVAIYLFGSCAQGVQTKESDVDFFIILESSDEQWYRRPLKGYEALDDLHIPYDLIVYTKNEFQEKIKNVSTLAYKIKEEGKQIYARA